MSSKMKPVNPGDCSASASCTDLVEGLFAPVDEGAVETVGTSEDLEFAFELESTE